MAKLDSNVAIRIAADFVGLPAFKKADTAVDKLYKSTTKLAAAFGVTFSAAALGRFGATAVREFASAEREAQTLLGTMKSLNLAFAAPELGAYLDDLERLTGINRGELQPALQKLVTQTGSITKAQEILNTAVKVSFSGLMDVSTAANALTQAYVGNVKGLRSFNLGLTSTELSLLTFDQILAKVANTYDGQFAEALDSTTVKLNKVKNASENLKESIGEGLVKAFSNLAGNGDIDKATSKLEKFGELAGRIIGNLFTPTKVGDFYLPIPNLFKKPTSTNTMGSPASWHEKNVALAKAEAKAAANAKKIEDAKLATLRKQNAERAKKALLDKADAVLAKAKAQFDLEGIQLAAALMNKSLSAEEVRRLEIKQKIWEIEQAQAAGDLALLETLLKQLEALMKQQLQMAELLKATNQLKALFDLIGFDKELIDTLNLKEALELLKQIQAVKFATVSGGTALQGTSFGGVSPLSVIAYSNDITKANPNMPVFYEGFSGFSGSDPNTAGNIAGGDIYVTAIVEGNVMSQYDLATAIREQIQDAQQSGKPVNWARQALPATFL